MKDVIRLDSCQSISAQLQKENNLLDSLIRERGLYIEFLTAYKAAQDSLLKSTLFSLDRCLYLHEKKQLTGFKFLLKKLTDPWVIIPTVLLIQSTILHIK